MATVKYNYFKIIFLTLIVSCFLSYSIPQIYAFCVSDFFQYVNGWDETAYLSFQGAKASRFYPSYFALNVVYGLHLFGLSGAVQNLLFDALLTPVAFFGLYIFLKDNVSDAMDAAVFSILILFSGIIFSYVNPIVRALYGLPRNAHFLMPGADAFISVLRTPNPQFSIFLIILSVWLYGKIIRKEWILCLPIPLLYVFVLVPYASLVTLFILFKRGYLKNYINIVAANIVVFFLFSIGFILLGMFFIKESDIVHTPQYFIGHDFYAPLSGVIALIIYIGLVLMSHRKDILMSNRDHFFLFSLLFTMFAVTNYQILCGYMITFKNFQDYGNYFIFGLFLVYSFYYVDKHLLIRRIYSDSFKSFFLLIIVIMMFNVSGFMFDKFYYKIYIGNSLVDKKAIKTIKRCPLESVIFSPYTAAGIAYSQSRMDFPILSYTYGLFFIYDTAQCYFKYLDQLNEWKPMAKSEREIVAKHTKRILKIRSLGGDRGDSENPKKCQLPEISFQIYKTDSSKAWQYFPNWPRIFSTE